jgi:hypothetical protein
MLSDDSGGGSFFVGATLTAFVGASSLFVPPSPSVLAPGSEAIGACDDAGIAKLLVVVSASCQMSIFCCDAAEFRNADARDEARRGYDSGANQSQTKVPHKTMKQGSLVTLFEFIDFSYNHVCMPLTETPAKSLQVLTHTRLGVPRKYQYLLED